jgi:4-amino-4-deoxy-L-arabinose transferase-like glycosyltransferase
MFLKKIKIDYLVLLVFLLFFSLVRLNLADIPLERDEGEFAYMAQLMLKGTAPYTEAYNMKMPFIYLIYQFKMMLLGQSTAGIRHGLLLANLLSIFLVFKISKKLLSTIGALISSFVFSFIILSSNLLSHSAHANHYVVLLFLIAIFLILIPKKKNLAHYFLAGMFMASSVFTKQSSFVFPIFGLILCLYVDKKYIKNSLSYIVGGVFFTIIILLWLYLNGAFANYWFFTIESSLAMGTDISFSRAFNTFISMTAIVIKHFYFFWIFGIIGYIVLLLDKERKVEDKILLSSFIILSFVSILPGAYFRHHYYLTLIPAIAIGNALFVDNLMLFLKKHLKNKYSILIVAILFFLISFPAIFFNNEYYFANDKNYLSRMIYGVNPFVESPKIAEFLRKNTVPTDKIAILGSEAQILFYSGLQSATGYIYTYHMVENQKYAKQMQTQMIQEIEKEKPKYIIFVNIITSWLFQKGAPKNLLQWYEEYVPTNYRLAGIVDIAYFDRSIYIFDEYVNQYQPLSDNLIFIWEIL